MNHTSTFKSQAARGAQASGYGEERYWAYLEYACLSHRDYYLERGDQASADRVMTESLGDALRGNNGD